MYIEAVPNRSSPPAILLRESFRDNGRVRKRTLANLSDWPTPLVEGFRTLLKGGVAVAAEGIRIRRALPHGHAAAVLGTIPLDRPLSFLDVLLRGAAMVVEGDDALSRPRQVGDDEADARVKLARMPL